MKIYLHQISDMETKLEFTQDDSWVSQVVFRIDEHVEGSTRPPQPRPIHAHLSLRKVDDVVVVSGKIESYIELVCSRCATLFQHACRPSFSALFCKDPVMAGVAHLQRQETGASARPMGQNQGFARHAHDHDEDVVQAEGKDLDITYLSHEYIELGDVLAEQLQLQVPFQPLCKETCLGMCSNCGADLNSGKCACSKIKVTTPFSVLRDIKL